MAELGNQINSVAFYLPQYHPISENDEWWGAGFTDWVNVAKAQPRFKGHIQPHVPMDGDYYDPRDDATRERQFARASAGRIDAFCYYHYWFNGRRLLEQPVARMLDSGIPKMPFILCWANENWTRRWDGKDREVLMKQHYSTDDDQAHILSLLPVFADPRYGTINGRPIFVVYRASLFPEPQRTTDLWRDSVTAAGLPEPFLVRMESTRAERGDPRLIGFDASVDFQPHLYQPTRAVRALVRQNLNRLHLSKHAVPADTIRDYPKYSSRQAGMAPAKYPRFPGIMPGWDNTARRRRGAVIFHGSTPELYASWLGKIVEGPLLASAPAPLVFVNAWNEWAEGAHIEPDEYWGTAYLDAHARVIDRARQGARLSTDSTSA